MMNLHEFTFNGLTFGGASQFGLRRISGLSSPNVRVESVDRAVNHGSHVFAAFLSERKIVVEGDVHAPGTDFQTAVQALGTAFVPQVNPLPLVFLFPGAGSITKVIYALPTKFEFTVDPMYSIEYAEWIAEFTAPDPRIYSNELHTLATTAASSSGMGFPLGFPFGFGIVTGSGALIVSNAGNFPTPPFVRVEGPCASPTIRNQTLDREIAINGLALNAGEALDFDFKQKTVRMATGQSRYSYLDPSSRWWELDPGINDVRYLSEDGGGTMRIYWQDAWISL